MSDKLIRGIAAGGQLRCFAADTTETVKKMAELHRMKNLAAAATGRLATAAVLLAADIKEEGATVIMTVKGGGPLGKLVAAARPDGCVKAYAENPQVVLPLNSKGKLNVGAGVGREGELSVTKAYPKAKAYEGRTPLVSGEIGEDVAAYLFSSEQKPSVVALGVLCGKDGGVLKAGGYILQPLPGASDEFLTKLEERIANIKPTTTMLAEGMTPEDILHLLTDDLEGDPMVIFDRDENGELHRAPAEPAGLTIAEEGTIEPRFHCDCSRTRLEEVLISLGAKELRSLAAESTATLRNGTVMKGAELVCPYCSRKYIFSDKELIALADSIHGKY